MVVEQGVVGNCKMLATIGKKYWHIYFCFSSWLVSTKRGKNYFICKECNFAYKDKETAAKCEAWCKEYKSCNVEITKHAVNF